MARRKPGDPPKDAPDRDDPALRVVLKDLSDAQEWHDEFVTKCDSWYRTYRGIMEERSKASQWTNRVHPPYAMQVAETIVANLVDEKLRFSGKPRPRVETDMVLLDTLRDAARAQEYMINAQLAACHFQEKLRPFYLQNVVCGLTVTKQYWKRTQRDVRQRRQRVEPQLDEFGQVVGSTVVTEVVKRPLVTYEDAYVEIVDVRDFWWCPGGAVELDRVTSASHRAWMTKDEIDQLEQAGTYRKGSCQKLSDTRDFSGLASDRERDIFQVSRTKGMVEVIERWSHDQVITIANRAVVLREEENPFWHGDLPFVACSTRPEMFRIPGVSEIEQISGLQEALWTLTNQRLDNTELLNNAVVFHRSDVDPEELEIAPGATNETEGNPQDAVWVWSPTPLSAQISIPAEQSLRGDIQNISGAAPFASGADSTAIDQQTATGVSIITTLAQRILASKKQNGYNALLRMVDQIAWLDRQFMPEARVIELAGGEGAREYFTVQPEHFDPIVQFEFDPASESMMQQQRRAESQALVQVLLESFQPAMVSGAPINVGEVLRYHLRQYGIDDPDRFFLPPGQNPMQAAMPGAQPVPGAEVATPNGVTSPLATAPSSPSNGNSMSPVAAQQRMLSQTGPIQ